MSQIPRALGPYQILAELGRGGMGVVYRALHEELGHEVALKVLLDTSETDEQTGLRFQREARAAARLAAHPNIVGVRDVGVVDGRLFLAMDLVRGIPLDEMIAGGELSPVKAAAICAQVARALSHAHTHGILHRDVKPSNIIVGYDHGARLTDFGLAKSTVLGGDAKKITSSEILVGTPAYASPEQIKGEGLDPRADVYSLGATLYEALTGTPPFVADAVQAVLMQALQGNPEPPAQVRPGVPPACEAIALRALALNPDDRYASAADMAEDLENFVCGAPVRAMAAPHRARTAGRGCRSHAAIIGGAVAAGALIVGGALVWRAVRRTDVAEAGARTVERAGAVAERDRRASDTFDQLRATALPALQALEGHRHGRPLPPAALQATVDGVERAVDDVRGTAAPTPTMRAWAAYARALAGLSSPPGDSLSEVAAAAGDEPYPYLLLSLHHWSEYAITRMPLRLQFSREHVVVPPYTEPPDRAALRRRAETALQDALQGRWGRSDYAVTYQAFAKAAQGVATAPTPEAAAAAAATLQAYYDDPMLGRVAAVIAGTAQVRARKFDAGGNALMRAAAAGWPNEYASAGFARLAAATELSADPDAARERLEAAVALFDSALAARADHIGARSGLAMAHLVGARLAAATGAEAEPQFRAVVDELTRLMAMSPEPARDRVHRGLAWLDLARAQQAHGTDFRPALRESLEDLRTALERRPKDLTALNTLGDAWFLQAQVQFATGADPTSALDRSFDAAARVLAQDPAQVGAHNRRGLVWQHRGMWLETQGRDPRPAFRAAITAFEAALAQMPDLSDVRGNLAGARSALAMAGMRYGEAPEAGLQAALADYDRAVALDPQSANHRNNRALARLNLADVRRGTGGEIAPLLDGALADLEQAAVRNRRLWQAHALRGQVLEQLGRLADAVAAYEAALAVNPRAPTVAQLLAAAKARLAAGG